jgi:hypothetical protein
LKYFRCFRIPTPSRPLHYHLWLLSPWICQHFACFSRFSLFSLYQLFSLFSLLLKLQSLWT